MIQHFGETNSSKLGTAHKPPLLFQRCPLLKMVPHPRANETKFVFA